MVPLVPEPLVGEAHLPGSPLVFQFSEQASGAEMHGIWKCVCVWMGWVIYNNYWANDFPPLFFLLLGETAGINRVAFFSFAGMESVLDERFFQDPQISLANSKRKLKLNSRIVGGIITGEKKDGFSKPVIYTLENIEVCEEVSIGPPSAFWEFPILKWA